MSGDEAWVRQKMRELFTEHLMSGEPLRVLLLPQGRVKDSTKASDEELRESIRLESQYIKKSAYRDSWKNARRHLLEGGKLHHVANNYVGPGLVMAELLLEYRQQAGRSV